MEDADEGEVAVALLVIQAIADHECIRNVKAGVFNRQLNPPAGTLIEESTDIQVRWMVRHEMVPEVLEADTRIDNIFDNQYVLVGDTLGQILENMDPTRRHMAIAITGEGNIIDCQR